MKPDLTKLCKHYSQTYHQYGFNSKGADWGSKSKHELRILSMINALGEGAFANCSVLDVGCGYGILHSLLKRHYPDIKLSYYGIDPCIEVIDYAKSSSDPEAEFLCCDIQSFSPPILFDTVFCCGIFTKKASMTDDEMYELLSCFFALLKKTKPSSVSFNTMSPFCDRHDHDLFYPSYERILGMLIDSFGYSLSDFVLSNSHLKYEMIWRFSVER